MATVPLAVVIVPPFKAAASFASGFGDVFCLAVHVLAA